MPWHIVHVGSLTSDELLVTVCALDKKKEGISGRDQWGTGTSRRRGWRGSGMYEYHGGYFIRMIAREDTGVSKNNLPTQDKIENFSLRFT